METISLDVEGMVPETLLGRLCSEINSGYVAGLLARYRMPTDRETIETVAGSYSNGLPTQDSALKVLGLSSGSGLKFFGIAGGYGSRLERVAVKYLILSHIQDELKSARIRSELNIADLNPETVDYMQSRGMFEGKLQELMRVAGKLGNLENMVMGISASATS